MLRRFNTHIRFDLSNPKIITDDNETEVVHEITRADGWNVQNGEKKVKSGEEYEGNVKLGGENEIDCI